MLKTKLIKLVSSLIFVALLATARNAHGLIVDNVNPKDIESGQEQVISQKPTLSLKLKPPQLEKSTNISFAVKVLALVRPSFAYSYVPGMSKTFTGCFGPGAAMMIPCAEMTVYRVRAEVGPELTLVTISGKTEYVPGVGFAVGIITRFYVFTGVGWNINRSNVTYTGGVGTSL